MLVPYKSRLSFDCFSLLLKSLLTHPRSLLPFSYSLLPCKNSLDRFNLLSMSMSKSRSSSSFKSFNMTSSSKPNELLDDTFYEQALWCLPFLLLLRSDSVGFAKSGSSNWLSFCSSVTKAVDAVL